MAEFSPLRLKEIRILRGFTSEYLASQVGVTKQAISKYECGQSLPALDTVKKLINILSIPENYLSNENLSYSKASSALFFRTTKSTRQREIEFADIQSKWGYETLLGIDSFEKISEMNLPDFDDTVSIPEKAAQLRSYWNLGIGPIENVTDTLEKNGIYVFIIDTSNIHVDAYSRIINNIPIIVLNKQRGTAVRWRFNLAHELGHLVLHAALSKDMIKNDYKKVEREANLFASSFLLPKESFGKVMIMPGLDYFIQLKQEWKISIAAMIYRCKELGMINAQRSGRLQIQIFKKKWRDKEPLDNEIEFEYPAFLLDLAHKYLNNKNNVERFVNLTRLPVSDVERLCLLPDGYFVGYGVGHAIQSGYRQLSLFGRD